MSEFSAEDVIRTQKLVDLVVSIHERGYFINDPSPAALSWDDKGTPSIDDVDLVNRSHVDIPHLVLSQLWSLMYGASPRRRIDAASEYLKRREMDADSETAMKEHIAREIQRCFHTNRDFKIIQAGGLVWHARHEAMNDAHRIVLEDPDAFLQPSPTLIKDSRATTVARTAGQALLKRFNLKKYRNIVKHQFSPSRARSAYKRAYHLEMIGIRTPRVLAYADKKVLGCIHKSYLLMDYLPDVQIGAETLKALAIERADQRLDLLSSAGRLVGLLHGEGFSNRDLKASNLLVSDPGDLWLVDLDGIKHLETVSAAVRIKNLRRMVRDLPHYGDLSLREKLRFLSSYCLGVQNGQPKELFRTLSRVD
ncbi:MAG: tRNA A-37 threonylcarbamoyl transferase component Bud32 [Planctomycetota bacterium]|jgi:tRNA A-37 threonylcarbamoyl transferase component Bud32